MKNHILIIDDDIDYVSLISKYLQAKGMTVLRAGSIKEGQEIIKAEDPEVVLLDVILPDHSGVENVAMIKGMNEEIPIIMVSGHDDTKLVVGAMRAGASDYLKKPVDHNELINKINKLIDMRATQYSEHELESTNEYGVIIGKSALTRQVIREVSKVANADAPVLLRGETGTGKSLIAQIIHARSRRKDKPCVTINCAAIPENLLESEFFGHEKGSFTGAIREKIGKFEFANGGTIFLDEIGELSPELQVKLLRVLQGQEFERVGGLKTIRVDVRIIAATNRNLEKAIQEHHFREDLFYRLNVLPIYIPSLRQRKEDISVLVEHFVKYYSRKCNKRFDPLTDVVMENLVQYDWPGNIRELQNVIERAIILAREPHLRLTDFIINNGTMLQPKPVHAEIVTSLRDLEYQALLKAIKQTGGNLSQAAKLLGVGRDTIYRRLKKYGIGLKRSAIA